MAVLALTFAREVQFRPRRFLSFLDESVQQNDFTGLDAEQRPGDAINEAGADFPQPVAKRIHKRFYEALYEELASKK